MVVQVATVSYLVFPPAFGGTISRPCYQLLAIQNQEALAKTTDLTGVGGPWLRPRPGGDPGRALWNQRWGIWAHAERGLGSRSTG